MKGVGQIDKAIKIGKAGIKQDRRMPGYYKHVALGYKEKGGIEASKYTISRGLLYFADKMRSCLCTNGMLVHKYRRELLPSVAELNNVSNLANFAFAATAH